MSHPISNPTTTLQVAKPSSEVNEAITFIPALSTKYKLTKTGPAQQMYTLSGDEPSASGAYIDISFSSVRKNITEIKIVVRRKTDSYKNSRNVSVANQHIDTVLNLLTDSLALDPSEKSRLVSATENKKSVDEHHRSQAITEAAKDMSEKKQAKPLFSQVLIKVALFVLLAAVLYGLYWIIKP